MNVYGADMLRRRARVGRATAVLLGLALAVAGCGDDSPKAEQPSKADVSCRQQWKALEKKVGGRDTATNPSALPQRWNSIAVTLDYYAGSARAKDCGTTLSTQSAAIDAVGAFSTKLAAYDMELRLDEVKSDAQAYADGPQPAAPSPSAPVKGKVKGKKKPKAAPPAPRPADIAVALKTLTTQAPLATQQQGPGWQQADVADLDDAAAVAKSVKDLAFLSSESAAYRACGAALAQITTALAVS
jgi:hypothetical protein